MWLRRGFSNFLQDAKKLPIDSTVVADFALKLEAANHRNAETWNELQLKFLKGGFPFDAAKSFLSSASKVGVSLLPEFRRDLEDLIMNGILSKGKTLRLLRYYAFLNGSEAYLASFFTKYSNVNYLIITPNLAVNAYAAFWKVANDDFKHHLFRYIYSDECPVFLKYRCYKYAVILGDTERMDLANSFAGKINALGQSFTDFGEKIVTVSNFAKYKEEWLAFVPSQIATEKIGDISKLFKVLKKLNPPPESYPAIVAALVALPETIQLHEKIILAKEISEATEQISKMYAKELQVAVEKLKESNLDEAMIFEALLAEILSKEEQGSI